MQFGSYSFSIFLHLGLLALVWFWPSSPPLRPDQPMMQISLTMGAPGGNRLPSSVLGPQGRPNPTVAASKPAPREEVPGAVAIPREDMVQPKMESKQESRPKPQPKPEAVKLAEKKEPVQPSKKEPEAPPAPKEKPKEKTPEKPKQPETPKEAKPTAKPKETQNTPQKPSKDAVKAALADAARKTDSQRSSGKGRSSIAGALADLEKAAKNNGQGGGGGGEGDGPGGGGIYDVYAGMVILAIRPNWSMPTYSRAQMIVQVRVKLDRNGQVLGCSIERSSGRADFDASAVNAVIRTKTLPPPPTPEQQELVLTFNSQEMMGH